jgi:hypothetical protein
MSSRAEILQFLLEFKTALQAGHWSIVQRRDLYAQETELSVKSIKIILMELTPEQYVKGPDEDRNRPGEYLWVFHRPDGEKPYFYIKLKMDHSYAKVLSFHRTRFQ